MKKHLRVLFFLDIWVIFIKILKKVFLPNFFIRRIPMKRTAILLFFMLIAVSVNAMDFDLTFDPCIELNIGTINNHISLGISTEVPFWKPTHLRIRYQYLTENKNDIFADLISVDVVYTIKDRQTSGYRFYPYIAAGAHFMFPDHDNYNLHSTPGFQAYIGCYYKLAPFHYLFFESGIARLKYKPKGFHSYTENKLFANIGYKLVF